MVYSGTYFFPPRTEARIPYTESSVLSMWKSYPDAIAQYKLNGNRNVIKVSPDRKVEFWNRHAEMQKYVIPAPIREAILSISPEGFWTVWDSELLHTKTKTVKNVIYVFDCLVWKSEHMYGNTYAERYAICEGGLNGKYFLFTKPEQGVYLARNISVADWDAAWDEAKKFTFCEGLVLKRTGQSSQLTYGASPVNNSGFMCRVRKHGKNMTF